MSKLAEEKIKEILNISFSDFYDQEDHTIQEIDGAEEALRKAFQEIERLEMRRCQQNKT